MDGHEVHGSEATVDASYELIHSRTQVLILLNVLSRRDGELRQDNLPDPFRMLREEELERVKLLGDTFDVIKTVDADDDLASAETLLELSDTLLDGILLEVVDEGGRVDTNGEGADMREAALELYAVRHGGKAENAGA